MPNEPFQYSGKLAFLRRACVDARLQRTDLAVLAVLIDHANMVTGKTPVSVATIIGESSVPKSTVLRALRRLTGFGFIAIEKRFGAASTYCLTGSDAGAGSDTGTGVIWNSTGAIQNLRRGKTSSDAGAEPVPTPGHIQKKSKATDLIDRAGDGFKGRLLREVMSEAEIAAINEQGAQRLGVVV